jgi:cytochrome c553
MRLRRLTSLAGVLGLLAAVSVPASAEGGDPVAGRDKTAMCAGCHGVAGFRNAYPQVYSVPKIGGQNEAYIVNALKAYRAGDRNHATMMAIASRLSDQDIADLAAFYSGEK